MAADLVIVRAYGGKPLIRAVLDVMPGGMLVCMPENEGAIRRGEMAAPVVGFPADAIFRYSAREAQAIGRGASVNWDRLEPMKEAAN